MSIAKEKPNTKKRPREDSIMEDELKEQVPTIKRSLPQGVHEIIELDSETDHAPTVTRDCALAEKPPKYEIDLEPDVPPHEQPKVDSAAAPTTHTTVVEGGIFIGRQKGNVIFQVGTGQAQSPPVAQSPPKQPRPAAAKKTVVQGGIFIGQQTGNVIFNFGPGYNGHAQPPPPKGRIVRNGIGHHSGGTLTFNFK